MAGAGAATTFATARRGDPVAVPVAFGYFTAMEALQGAGDRVLYACGTPANEVVTFLSILHIVVEPFFIDAFEVEFVARRLGPSKRAAVISACGVASVTMLLGLYPFAWAAACEPGSVICVSMHCTTAGDWHVAWSAPLNDLFTWQMPFLGTHMGWTGYHVTAFGLPLLNGASRYVVFPAGAGPVLGTSLTTNPNEMLAIWCLFSIPRRRPQPLDQGAAVGPWWAGRRAMA